MVLIDADWCWCWLMLIDPCWRWLMLIDAYWWRFWCWYWLMMIDSHWCWLICINTLFVALASLAPTPAKWVSPLWENQNIWEMFQKWILNSKTVFTGMSLVDWELVQNAKYFSSSYISAFSNKNCCHPQLLWQLRESPRKKWAATVFDIFYICPRPTSSFFRVTFTNNL